MSWPGRSRWGRPAVAGDRAVDDTRIVLAHPLVADAQAVEHAGPEGLEHESYPRTSRAAPRGRPRSSDRSESSACCGSATGTAPTWRDVGALDRTEGTSGCSRRCRCPRPQHVRAEVREQQRAEAAGQQPGEVEHAYASSGRLMRLPSRAGCQHRPRLGDGRRAAPKSSVICRAFAISSPLERPSSRRAGRGCPPGRP